MLELGRPSTRRCSCLPGVTRSGLASVPGHRTLAASRSCRRGTAVSSGNPPRYAANQAHELSPVTGGRVPAHGAGTSSSRAGAGAGSGRPSGAPRRLVRPRRRCRAAVKHGTGAALRGARALGAALPEAPFREFRRLPAVGGTAVALGDAHLARGVDPLTLLVVLDARRSRQGPADRARQVVGLGLASPSAAHPCLPPRPAASRSRSRAGRPGGIRAHRNGTTRPAA